MTTIFSERGDLNSHYGPWVHKCSHDAARSGAAAGHHGTHHKNDKEMNRTWPRRHRITGLQFPPSQVFPDIVKGLRYALGTSAQGDQCCSGIEGYGLMAYAFRKVSCFVEESSKANMFKAGAPSMTVWEVREKLK